ncbi:hypothetical protein ACU063_18250 [Paenibacillus sp. M.A.Huq-81]
MMAAMMVTAATTAHVAANAANDAALLQNFPFFNFTDNVFALFMFVMIIMVVMMMIIIVAAMFPCHESRLTGTKQEASCWSTEEQFVLSHVFTFFFLKYYML